nr:hypothetical protein BaRGS_027103 [Batillaria attramentaria]
MCCKDCNWRRVLYVLGLALCVFGIVSFMIGFLSGAWVFRTEPTTQTNDTVASYGLWEACDPDDSCGTLFERIPSVAVTAFLGMLIFSGEIKNAAPREIGQEDETGRGSQQTTVE